MQVQTCHRRGAWRLLLAGLVATTGIACAETAEDCKRNFSTDEPARLACYDRVHNFQKPAPVPASTSQTPAATTPTASAKAGADDAGKDRAKSGVSCFLQGFSGIRRTGHDAAEEYSLDRQWGLRKDDNLNELQPYRPNYAIFRHSDAVNTAPYSPAAGHAVTDAESFQFTELKFQLSFKSELIAPGCIEQLVNSDRWRFWFAFTQQSNWQILNGATSRPFRNSNYEPEAIVTYRFSDDDTNRLKPRLLNLAFVHQSNGQANPKSRSWNRVYLQGGWQLSKEWSLLARGWYRLRDSDDDNPDIQSYLGRGDAVLRWGSGSNAVQLLARNTFHANHNREFLQLDYSFQFRGIGPKLHLQASSGFGESLIDYNFRQKTIGLGLSFDDW